MMDIDSDPTELQFVELDIEDENDLDEKIYQYLEPGDLELSGDRRKLVKLILTVVALYSHQLDVDVNSIPKEGHLLDKLHELVRAALETNNFSKIRRLELLQKPQKPVPVMVSSVTSSTLLTPGIRNAWRIEYIGNHAKLLLMNIKEMAKKEGAYSKQVSVIQSSGTGKSRMVHELSKLVFTIPFNIRAAADTLEGAFPHPDGVIRDYMVIQPGTKKIDVELHYMRFLSATFQVIADELENKMKEIGKVLNARQCAKRRQDFAKWWSDYLEAGSRERLYKKIVSSAKTMKPADTNNKNLVEAQSEDADEFLEQLCGVIELIVGERTEIEVVIYFDEAHTLTDVFESEGFKTLYDIFCSTASHFHRMPSFFIFLSTNSSLPKFAATRDEANSARIARGDVELNTPITETPFDCHPDIVNNGELSLQDTTSIMFLARFGRPLFWTLLKSKMTRTIQAEVMALAKKKLLHSTPSSIKEEGKIAVLDVALNLNYEPLRTQNRKLQDTLVASHSRIVYAIPTHREFMHTGYPSEPLLAEAANQLLYEWETKSSSFCIDTVTRHYGILDKGRIGEMVARLIMSGAYRRAVTAEKSNPLNFSAGCSLTTFIKELFPADYAEMILKSKPDNVAGGLNFETAFKDAVVRFTHFVTMATQGGDPKKAPEDGWAWTNMAWAMFVRSAAIICHPTQDIIDFIIPILLKAKGKIDEYVMSAILIQVKNRTKAGQVNALLIDAIQVKLFPKNTEYFRPYVALVMDMGIIHEVGEIYKYEAGTDRKADSEHQRYQYFVYGCSSAIFKNVDEDKFASILRTYDLFSDHARQNDESMAAVQMMKPVWRSGKDCFSWVGDPILRASPPKAKKTKTDVIAARPNDNESYDEGVSMET